MYRLCTGYPTTTVVKLVHHICTCMIYVFNERKTVICDDIYIYIHVDYVRLLWPLAPSQAGDS